MTEPEFPPDRLDDHAQDTVIMWRCTYCGHEDKWLERMDLTQRYTEPLVREECGWRVVTTPPIVIGPDER